VLGAGVSNVVGLLSKDFLRLVILAIMVATPLAWWAMRRWLQGFAYRDVIHWLVFLSAGLGALLIAAITVSTQAFKAARVNPVDSLRGE
jgi:putative ABC transport system permease protein